MAASHITIVHEKGNENKLNLCLQNDKGNI